VKLLDGPFKHARDLNIETILKYNVDRLLAGYRKQAGLKPKDSSFSNWDGLDGHVAGHYLSALAMNYASTQNAECKKKLDYVLAELKACQDANDKNNSGWGKGYVGAVPNSKQIWSTFQKGDFTGFKAAWVPWYNIHKMYAGLRDAWNYAGNETAKQLFLKFCDWGIAVTSNLTDEQMQSMLDVEHGGMNEIFADAYQITGDKKYLTAAKRFSHNILLNAMAADKDNLDNKHANTQVPKAIGFQRIAEVSNEKNYTDAGSFFWQTVTTNRSLAFGGNSRREHFPDANTCSEFITDVQGPESCNSYNMLKLTEDLFRENPSEKYVDYYERTLFNHILSTQHPVHGGYVYFTPARPRHYRVYSAPNQAMWCCVGSGMENHSKYNQFIYTHTKDELYLNLFIASELNWKQKGIKLRQETQFPNEEQTKLTITEGTADFILMIRYPGWVKKGTLKIELNGHDVAYKDKPGSYVEFRSLWRKGDVVVISFPMQNTIEQLPNVSNYFAFMHGPILLAAKTGTEDLKGLIADDGRWAHIASGKELPLTMAPYIIENDIASLTNKLGPALGTPLTFTNPQIKFSNRNDLVLEPFYKIHDSRYMMYWKVVQDEKNIQVLAGSPIGEMKPFWSYFGYDEPNYTTRKDGQKLLTELTQLSPTTVYVRTHNLLTSKGNSIGPDLKWGYTDAYKEDANGKAIYDWTIVDSIIDTYIQRGIKPLMEIGFMPKDLASKPEPYDHTWSKGGNLWTGWTSPPKDYNKWRELIYQWVKHSIERYSKKEVTTWLWEVWNEPDIPYWSGTFEEYCKLYDYAVDGLKKACPECTIGGPHTTSPRSDKAYKYLTDFIEHCLRGKNYATGKTGTPLQYIGFHAKGSPEFVDGHIRMNMAVQLKDIDRAFQAVTSFPELKNIPIIIGECDPEGCAACSEKRDPRYGYRNGTTYSSYTAASFARIYELMDRHQVNLKGVVSWSFEFEDQEWFAGFRELATHGVNKPVLNVFRMFGMMSGKRVLVKTTGRLSASNTISNGVRGKNDVDAIASRDSNSISVMVWNYHDDDLPGPSTPIELNVSAAGKNKVLIQHFRIDQQFSNSFEKWKSMGKPQQVTDEQYKELEKAGQLQLYTSPEWMATKNGGVTLKFDLPAQGVSLIRITW